MVNDADSNGGACLVRSALRESLHRRKASLTGVEKAFLHALLIDEPSSVEDGRDHRRRMESATRVLDDDILFSIPFANDARVDREGAEGARGHDRKTNSQNEVTREEGEPPKPPRPTRSNQAQLDLWRAHSDGVRPRLLSMRSSRSISVRSNGSRDSFGQSTSCDSQIDNIIEPKQSRWRKSGSPLNRRSNDCVINGDCEQDNNQQSKHQEDGEAHEADSLGVFSDREVGNINDESSASSWDSSQGGFDHYDAWEVLRDEYASDFGFGVAVDDEERSLPSEDGAGQRGLFKILGTSADDAGALPHVLSPPLMDSLLNFVPERLAYDNFWLKFSLVRDGASLATLKRYCRAATHTVLAIETTNGEVFGAFASSPWRTSSRYFGTGEAFLWRMRHGRNTPVHCLFEQAQLESEIDVFPYNGSNDYVQLCTGDRIALGGGTVLNEGPIVEHEALDAPAVFLEDQVYGFGLALDENLLHGTTSPSATFGNSNLLDGAGAGETFDVMNLEVWGFTSAPTERAAQKSELSMFYVRESISSRLSRDHSSSVTSTSSVFSGDDLSRESFYRRVGQNDEGAADRDAWQYANMMNPMVGSPYGGMRSSYGR